MTQLEILIKGYEIGIEKNPISGGIELAKIAASLKGESKNLCPQCKHGNITCTAIGDGKGYPQYTTTNEGFSFSIISCNRYEIK